MSSPQQKFDSDGFYRAIAATVAARAATWKQVSRETGVSATTLTRMSQGRRPDAASLAALSAWANLNPAEFVSGRPDGGRPEPLAQIGRLLRSDRRLSSNAAQTIEVMVRTAYEQLSDRSGESNHPDTRQRKRNS